jgi:hypothetical protein
MLDWPIARWYTTAGVHGKAKPLTSWPESKREEETRILFPFRGLIPNYLLTSHQNPPLKSSTPSH